ncbi:FixH family protein [Alkalihalophilus marmarensis]|uniref:FixH family protein n=1 Tax=Alkalihalophilus marmarensis TaxID=521377 RepID=UPI002DBF79A8|nr:FixH family protein [Alkalihalophilus marmarensis]MEC2070574.1 FixH family protein [Alkalihalophilus marmarensis]
MKRLVMMTVAALTALSACGGAESDEMEMGMDDQLTPIEVELVVPDQAEVNEEVLFESHVTQGDDLVEDANEVVYEVWQEGQKDSSEMIEATDQDGNNYMLTHVFEEEGRYHVQTHVTARGLHRMPIAEIQIGSVESSAEEGQEPHEHERSDTSEHHHQHAEIEIEMTKEQDGVTFFIEVNGEELTDGIVTIEMWQNEDDKHIWLDTSEEGEGRYKLSVDEEYSGEYEAVIHIEREHDSLHEHINKTITF